MPPPSSQRPDGPSRPQSSTPVRRSRQPGRPETETTPSRINANSDGADGRRQRESSPWTRNDGFNPELVFQTRTPDFGAAVSVSPPRRRLRPQRSGLEPALTHPLATDILPTRESGMLGSSLRRPPTRTLDPDSGSDDNMPIQSVFGRSDMYGLHARPAAVTDERRSDRTTANLSTGRTSRTKGSVIPTGEAGNESDEPGPNSQMMKSQTSEQDRDLARQLGRLDLGTTPSSTSLNITKEAGSNQLVDGPPELKQRGSRAAGKLPKEDITTDGGDNNNPVATVVAMATPGSSIDDDGKWKNDEQRHEEDRKRQEEVAVTRAEQRVDLFHQKWQTKFTVKISFLPVGDAPRFSVSKNWECAADRFRPFYEVIAFITGRVSKRLTTEARRRDKAAGGDGTSVTIRKPVVHCFLQASFAPSMDALVGDLFDCFRSNEELQVYYALSHAFG